MAYQIQPFEIIVYMGEGRLVVEPLLKNTYGRWVTEPTAHEIITDCTNINLIGETILRWFEYIRTSTLSDRSAHDEPTFLAYTKYNNWSSFFKNNLQVWVTNKENSYIIIATARRSKRGCGSGYCGCVERIKLPDIASKEEIGQAVLQAFDASEKFHGVGKYKPKRQRKTTKTERV